MNTAHQDTESLRQHAELARHLEVELDSVSKALAHEQAETARLRSQLKAQVQLQPQLSVGQLADGRAKERELKTALRDARVKQLRVSVRCHRRSGAYCRCASTIFGSCLVHACIAKFPLHPS